MGLSILVAEDNDEILGTYQKILSMRGHTVQITSNGLKCFEVYKKNIEDLNIKNSKLNPFDIVLTDYAMPKIDGMKLARAILKLRPTQRIICSTAYPHDVRLETLRSKANVELLKKPFSLQELIDAVERKMTEKIDLEPANTIENAASKMSVKSWVMK